MTDFTQILQEFAENTIADIRYQMASYGMADSNLAKSLNAEIEGNEVKITAACYWDYAQKGRPAGKVPYNFQDIIATWAVGRGIIPPDLMKFANAVKWKTIKEGSSLYRHPEQQRDFIGDAIEVNIEQLKGQVGVFIMNDLSV